MGIAGNEDGDGSPAIGIPEYYRLNWARTTLDRTHNLQMHGIVELPFGKGKRWTNNGIGAAVLGGWQLNGVMSMYSGQPFTVTSPGTSLNAPGNSQRADLVKLEVARLGRAGQAGSEILRPNGVRGGEGCPIRYGWIQHSG